MLQKFQTVKIGNITIMQDARFIPQLRAWIDDGNGYQLAEIWNACAETKSAWVVNVGEDESKMYFCTYSEIHCIHSYNPHYNTVTIHGEPQL